MSVAEKPRPGLESVTLFGDVEQSLSFFFAALGVSSDVLRPKENMGGA